MRRQSVSRSWSRRRVLLLEGRLLRFNLVGEPIARERVHDAAADGDDAAEHRLPGRGLRHEGHADEDDNELVDIADHQEARRRKVPLCVDAGIADGDAGHA
eukprot:scaffold37178_cov60-Phaeocystis_antarctica.AAC.2